MNREQLQQMVDEGLSSYKISDRTGKSKTTVRYWLNKYSLGTKKVFRCACGEANPNNFFPGRYSECKRCRRRWQNGASKRNKTTLVEYKGGKCVCCGYNTYIGALDFHHLDPRGKDPNWKKMRHWSAERVKKEVDKCVLLCRNCHSEVHYNGKTISV